MYACYHCGKSIRGQVQHVIPPLYVTQLTGEGPKAYHPRCYEQSEKVAAEELFGLERQPQRGWQRGTFASSKTTQRPLLAGLDCLPGQGDLFETDGEGATA